MNLRTANPQKDYPRIAELISATRVEPVTAAMIASWDASYTAEALCCRSVLENDDGHIFGYSEVIHYPWKPDDQFSVWLTVEAAFRRHGYGTRLFEEALACVHQHGGRRQETEIREEAPEGLRFAEQRGFLIQHRIFESTLDLAAFDPQPFAEIIPAVEAAGIRLFSLAEAEDYESTFRKLWEVNRVTSLNSPAADGTFPDFEEFRGILENGKWFLPEGQWLAAEGERFIGLAAVGYFTETNSMYNMMTGVHPDYQGRRIAQALKLRAIRFAQQYGAAYIRTNNASNNAPMLAINQKLGYCPEPGYYILIRNEKN